MSNQDDDRFRIRIPSRKSHDRIPARGFVKRVLKAKARSALTVPPPHPGPYRKSKGVGARLGRGYVAARLAGDTLNARSRRVVVKVNLVRLTETNRRSMPTHLRYIQREAVGRNGERGELYSRNTDQADATEFENSTRNDRHQFRITVSPEDGVLLGDLKEYTRDLMRQMERDLATQLKWVAADHWNTDNPHTHILLRGKDDSGNDLIIASDYLTQGLRHRAAELATEWLGLRTEREIEESLNRQIDQQRWTPLDRDLQQLANQDVIDFRTTPTDLTERRHRARLRARLERLEVMGLAQRTERDTWTLSPSAEQTLRTMGSRADIILTMQRSFAEHREYSIFSASEPSAPITGRIVDKGLADEVSDRGYLIIDATDGRLHHVGLSASIDIADLPTGAIVTARSGVEPRAVDRTIAEIAQQGIYRTNQHLEIAASTHRAGQDPQAYVQAHVRRLEALRKAGIVERLSDGVWTVPNDLVARGLAYDARRVDGAQIDVQSYVPIAQQKRAIGATWLDRQLFSGAADISTTGFGATTREALAEREDFLVDQGLAERRNQRIILTRNLLATLRTRDLERAARTLETETTLTYNPASEGQRVSGTYQRSITLASGRFAMLENGMGFTLVPWRTVIEQRLGQTLAATVRGDYVSWEIGRQLGLSR